jgi:hypothetical protein
MNNLNHEEKIAFYDEIVKHLNYYTKLHIAIIKKLIEKMEEHIEMVLNVRGISKYCVFGWDFIAQETGFDDSIVVQILNDFVKDGLLMISARLPDTTVYGVTDRGNICFKKIIKQYKEKKEE